MNGSDAPAPQSVEGLAADLGTIAISPRRFGDLVGLGDAAVAALETCVKGASEPTAERRCLAVAALAVIGTSAARAALLSALETCIAREELEPALAEAERSVMSAIADRLGVLGQFTAVPVLLEALRRHGIAGCVRALGHLRIEAAMPLRDEELEGDLARGTASEALRNFGDAALPHLRPFVVQLLTPSALEPAWHDSRVAAVVSLAKHADPTARMLLIWSLFVPAAPVRLATAISLAAVALEGAMAIPTLIDVLGSESWSEPDSAVQALATLGPAATIAACGVAADEAASLHERRRAIIVLGRLDSAEAGDGLARAARSRDALVRLEVATVLATSTVASATATLRCLLDDEQAGVRASAIRAFGQREPTDFRAIAPLLGDSDSLVTDAVRASLSRGGREALVVLAEVRDGRLPCRGGWIGARRAREEADSLALSIERAEPPDNEQTPRQSEGVE